MAQDFRSEYRRLMRRLDELKRQHKLQVATINRLIDDVQAACPHTRRHTIGVEAMGMDSWTVCQVCEKVL